MNDNQRASRQAQSIIRRTLSAFPDRGYTVSQMVAMTQDVADRATLQRAIRELIKRGAIKPLATASARAGAPRYQLPMNADE